MSGWLARIAGGVIGGGGAWLALSVTTWNPGLPIAASIAGAMAAAGLWFGPKIWRVVIELA